MKIRHLIILLTGIAVISCKTDKNKKDKIEKNKLVGTWKLIEYTDYDTATNKWINPYGNHPKGYFTYTKSGIVNLNVSGNPDI